MMTKEELRCAAKDIKIAVFDMDGTLFNQKSILTERTQAALKKLEEKGILLIPASGRDYYDIRKIFHGIAEISYSITSNGALLMDVRQEKCLQKKIIPAETVESILTDFSGMNPLLYIQSDSPDESYLFVKNNAFGFADLAEQYGWKPPEKQYETEDLIQRTKSGELQVYKIGLFHQGTPKAYEEHIGRFYPSIRCFRTSRHSLELNAADVSKAAGLQKICALLQLPLSSVCAIGDSGNDTEMLMVSGIGVAMGNADSEAKEVSDYVTLTNAEDGAALFMEEYLLGEVS